MKDLLKLSSACEWAVKNPAWIAKDGETFCNVAAQFIARIMGCHDFDDLMAEEIVKVMQSGTSKTDGMTWRQVDGKEASLWALGGGLGFAGMTKEELGEQHAHVAALAPKPMERSDSLDRLVPLVANVGKFPNAIERSSQAFPVSKGEAHYWLWDTVGKEA